MTSLVDALCAAIDFAAALPVADIAAALSDPANVGADAAALEDIVGALPLPPLDAAAAELAIAGFAWLIERAQAGEVRPDPDRSATRRPRRAGGRKATMSADRGSRADGAR